VHKSPTQNAAEKRRFPAEDLPQEDRRIEVHITHGPGGTRQVLLQDLSHGPGVGWYVQKTIRLDREQVDALLRSLCCVRHGGSLPCPDAAKSTGAPEARILSIESLLKS
jgi:hypothetical protein